MFYRPNPRWSIALALLVSACATAPVAKFSTSAGGAAAGAPPAGTPPAGLGSSAGSSTVTSTDGDSGTGGPAAGSADGSSPTPVPTSVASAGAAATPTATPHATSSSTGAYSGPPIGQGSPGTSNSAPAPLVPAQFAVTTLAGKGQQSWIDADGPNAAFTTPYALALQGNTALYVGDSGDHRIRRVDMTSAAHNVTTIAGSGSAGFADAIGASASFHGIQGLAVDAQNHLYVADAGNEVIRVVDLSSLSNAVVTTYAGIHGTSGSNNAAATLATFNTPSGLALVGTTLYVADAGNHCIRAIDTASPGNPVTTYAGTGGAGTGDGSASNAQFDTPSGLVADAAGNLYVSEVNVHTIRMISSADSTHAVTTLAGTAGISGLTNDNGAFARFSAPSALAIGPDGNLYVADAGNNVIRVVALADANHPVTTFAGSTAGFMDATAANAQFTSPAGLVWLGSALLVADAGNFRIRELQ